MIEKIKKIMNPLTIIAIFAGIAEISSTAVLPFLAPEPQSLFIWFTIIFPIILVIFFFATLNWNYKVLYAPSDFKDEKDFLRLFTKLSIAEQRQKIDNEVAETTVAQVKIEPKNQQRLEEAENNVTLIPKESSNCKSSQALNRMNYSLAEDLALRFLENEFHCEINRQVAFGGQYFFDGIIIQAGKIIGIEVKLFETEDFAIENINRFLVVVQKATHIAEQQGVQFSSILAVVTTVSGIRLINLKERLDSLIKGVSNVELKLFIFDHLKQIYGISDNS